MKFPIYQVIFFAFAIMLVASALMVIVARNPVRALLSLVLCFICSAGLWLMIQAEFLALVLIFVYVGAVMTLFLFVVMMLNIDLSKIREGFVRYLPYGIAIALLLIGMMVLILVHKHVSLPSTLPVWHSAAYSNTKVMGTLLFTHYIYPFEIAGAILLVAIIAAIALAFHGRKPGTKSQKVSMQQRVKKSDRLQIIKMKPESK
ncbi:MAG: NADH-quinone oxidoreductase subunit J [Gammaproteobacteria bacterium]|nr:NADH-quinone oxidoreductase subunit J [Gammaproteobacteria bacterium]